MGILTINSDFEKLFGVPMYIEFDSYNYNITGIEHTTIKEPFTVTNAWGNDVTDECEFTFVPDSGVTVENSYFDCSSMVGEHEITAYAYYQSTVTSYATLNINITDVPDAISFDQDEYVITGTEGDTISYAFTVIDDLGNNVTSSCQYTFDPDSGVTVDNGYFDLSALTAGTYNIDVTATIDNLTTTATISAEIESGSMEGAYMHFEALQDGNITLTIPASVTSNYMTSVSWSKDKSTWNDTTIDSTAQTITVPVTTGDKVYFKGVGKQLSSQGGINYCSKFASTGNVNVAGNIMSLLYGDDFTDKTSFQTGSERNFNMLFYKNSHIINTSQLVLPATTLTQYCYQHMLSGCTSLTTAPMLPATTLANYCYANMFDDCTSLTTAPALPATRLAMGCYQSMLWKCSALTTAPALPATSMYRQCYDGMFASCTSLTTAPELPATRLAQECYDGMFASCTSLTTAPELPATGLAQECYSNMFNGCTSLTTAPALPATYLMSSCYANMFKGCTNINYIKMLATNISEYGCLNNWVQNVQTTSGTFVKASTMNSLPSGNSGIPTNWTVLDYDEPA